VKSGSLREGAETGGNMRGGAETLEKKKRRKKEGFYPPRVLNLDLSKSVKKGKKKGTLWRIA